MNTSCVHIDSMRQITKYTAKVAPSNLSAPSDSFFGHSTSMPAISAVLPVLRLSLHGPLGVQHDRPHLGSAVECLPLREQGGALPAEAVPGGRHACSRDAVTEGHEQGGSEHEHHDEAHRGTHVRPASATMFATAQAAVSAIAR